MFIAHLPAGYLTARQVARRLGVSATPDLILAGMAGGIFPDIDLLYAILIDHWSVHHHRYWTHLPLVWLAISAAAVLLFRTSDAARQPLTVFLLAVWGHLLLDSIAGDIWWLWPWLDSPFSLVVIPAIHSPWWLNFLLHWTFALELGFALVAVWLAWKPRHVRSGKLAQRSMPRA
jgi:inner membrane protein